MFFSLLSAFFYGRKLKEEKYYPVIEKYAAEYLLDPALIKALVKTESGYDEKALSPAGAMGLMQIMPDTFVFVKERFRIPDGDIFDPEVNVCAGCAYISYLFSRFNEEETVLAAYNAGEGNVCLWLDDVRYSDDGKRLKNIPFPETRNFVLKVVSRKGSYE